MIRFFALYLPFILAYGTTWSWMWRTWHFRDGYYEHAPLVVGLAGLLVWRLRHRLGALAHTTELAGWWLLGPALLAHLAASALLIDSLSAASLILGVPGLVWLAHGAARVRLLLPILGLVVFVVPMPLVVSGNIAFELKEIAVEVGLDIANLLGVGAERNGAEIAIPGQTETLFVADSCSGLRTLVSLTTLGYCLAFFLGEQRGARRWVLVLLAAPIAIFTNALRIGAICVLARYFGVRYASTTGHDLANVIAWVVDLSLLLLADALLTRRRRP